MAPGSRTVDSVARGGPWLRKATRACSELGAPTTASGEAPLGPPGYEPGRRAVRLILAAGRRPDRATLRLEPQTAEVPGRCETHYREPKQPLRHVPDRSALV